MTMYFDEMLNIVKEMKDYEEKLFKSAKVTTEG
jgi:hypothetical protein